MVTFFLLVGLVIVRGFETYYFIKKVSKVCNQYDWKHVNQNDLLYLEMQKEDYYLTCEWSAYNFLYLKGPSPMAMFFSFKPLTIENQYNNEAVNTLKKYEII
jgi:hypothetical protein